MIVLAFLLFGSDEGYLAEWSFSLSGGIWKLFHRRLLFYYCIVLVGGFWLFSTSMSGGVSVFV